MRLRVWGFVLIASSCCAARLDGQVRGPFQLLDDEPDNIYLPPAGPAPEELTNRGGVHFSFDVSYLSTYVYRGVDQSTAPKRNEKALQFDGRLNFDFGKLPHPFFGVFSNIFNQDPVSRFEEVRPYAGLEWTLRPITVSGGFNGYIFPNREGKDTQEAWTEILVDDSRLWHTELPVLSPYAYGAYDFNKYKGFYLEAGLKHNFVIGDTGLVLTAVGDFAYVAHDAYFLVPGKMTETGFQHYDAGVIATYTVNPLLHMSHRYGLLQLKGYLYYSGPVNTDLRANSRVWGGVGLHFQY